MTDTGSAVRWLAGLDEAGLAELFERRPDVIAGVAPRDLDELAQRLRHPMSVARALRALPLAHVQLAEAVQAIGAGTTSRGKLAQLLSGTGPQHRAEVDWVVDDLVAWGVLAADGERLDVPRALAEVFPSPLGLGPPVRDLLRDRAVEAMRRVQIRLGVACQKSRDDTVDALVTHFSHAGNVRAILIRAPGEVQDYLLSMARGSRRPAAAPVDYDGDYPDEDDGYDDVLEVVTSYDPQSYHRRNTAMQWASEHGLVFAGPYSLGWQMPAEIALALRGPHYRAPFTPERPLVLIRPVDHARVEVDSAAAATQFADRALALLDHMVRAPVTSLKTGGIGTRELMKLAKVTAAGEVATRLVLELADAAGLLEHTEKTVTVSADFARWRADDPGDRFAELLAAWWAFGGTPTQTRDADGKPWRAVGRPGNCAGCREGRVVAIETLAGVDGAAEPASLAAAAFWLRPLAHVFEEEIPFATVLGEAELLGVVAHGALTVLGRVLCDGDAKTLRAHASGLLPQSADRATFGADLTVYVAGAPSAGVSALLDSAADREGHGGAVTWRFSPASVRRALDDGTTGTELGQRLAEIATGDLPQPLRYLLSDVARRHGNLRLSTAVSCVRSDDVALLAEVAADRKLVKLGLRLLAPTVLASERELGEVLTTLRKAGYFPMPEDTHGQDVGRAGTDHAPVALRLVRAGVVRAQPAPADPRAVAALLRRPASAQPESSTEQQLAELAVALTVSEIRQLAHAIDTQTRVAIEYRSAAGSITARVVDNAQLADGTLYAWCELRRDERAFTVERILSVAAVMNH